MTEQADPRPAKFQSVRIRKMRNHCSELVSRWRSIFAAGPLDQEDANPRVLRSRRATGPDPDELIRR